MEDQVIQIADQLWEAAISKNAIQPIRESIGIKDLDLAYKIQLHNNARQLDAGRKAVGAKIGLTSPAVQKQLGVDQPDYGLLMDHMQLENGSLCPWSELMQPKAEAEVAFVLGADISANQLSSLDPLAAIAADEEVVAAAIDYAVASIEIVGSRVANWDIRITDTIADNASASHFVLGEKRAALADLDLVNCQMQMQKNDAIASEGTGAACMGSPLIATVWLARTMARLGKPLAAGDIILTGALGPMVAVSPEDSFEASIEGLGVVNIRFSGI